LGHKSTLHRTLAFPPQHEIGDGEKEKKNEEEKIKPKNEELEEKSEERSGDFASF
jgi:hypothetical protein